MDAQAQAPVATAKSIAAPPSGRVAVLSAGSIESVPATALATPGISAPAAVGDVSPLSPTESDRLFRASVTRRSCSEWTRRSVTHPRARFGMGGRRKTSRMGAGGTMRQAVTVLSQLKKDEDGATLTKYTQR